jgi:NAD(P)-dependent dehydrogenase (short-subunit alcohol dehydrogenase family)
LLILKHLSPLLPAAKRGDRVPLRRRPAAVWANVSARVGSIGDNRSGGWYSYRASKAGLNAVTKSFDLYLRQKSGDNAVCVSLHPGTVRTGLSREFWDRVPDGGLFEPEFAAERLVEVVDGLRVEDRGGFYDWKGERVEW